MKKDEYKLTKDLIYGDLFGTDKVRVGILIKYAALEEMYNRKKGGVNLYNFIVQDSKYGHNLFNYYRLSESIKEDGILEPIRYSELGDFWTIRDGSHRISVALFFNIEKVPAKIASYKFREGRMFLWSTIYTRCGEFNYKLLYDIFLQLKNKYKN